MSNVRLAQATSGTPLLPDEDEDLRGEAKKFFADVDVWLNEPHPGLGGRTPNEAVQAGREEAVRNLLRTIKYIGIS